MPPTPGSRTPDAPRFSTIVVAIPGKPTHDIVVGSDILDELPRRIAAMDLPRDIFVISTPTIYGLYGERLRGALVAGGCARIEAALFSDGEEHKSLDTYAELCGKLHDAEERLATKLLIVNLGGGVVTDVGGFVAATYDRGRDYISLPTTLLGDVDSGVGGKTGINFRGKNLIGAFHQPKLVLADLSVLHTLPVREIRSALAEVIKYGVILDAELFAYLEAHVPQALAVEPEVTAHLVHRAFELKARTVEADERDTKGIRAKLNFGHTVGHALEAATAYGTFAHGEAVAVGMLCACEIAEGLGMFQAAETRRIEALCTAVGLPTRIVGASTDAILRYMQHDKKFVRGKNRFVLPTAIGEVVLKSGIDEALIRRVIDGRRA